ncbi:site-2 protease family protein [Listeria ivanovii]|uniref:Peptidase M50 domain-containing protein n=1 Tax=Listeria ivanovii (strain ATCC BAA-678 / PAM 55) TaxID=881621 RepID=G2ZFS5_LISIP|nr:site-2 protease family protein [Listeria ivanovii]AHI56991.1 zinc metalloprotease [Listeria ivanovii WSLC3009]AIS66406.1 zinc metalloprotease [Listeria ivanovii subsp. ivanovii]MBC1759793.1 site-2 protease family protein [Listeria ivanovii]MBK3915039.1 site-2 protease family protein [Listeria ivanovii subsp. ivanovii]MBK3922337.1 site-2 protease family protein [Listeria ivanovii subsp. ivanovii]
MPNFLAYPLELIPYVLVALLIAFTIHEWAHALVALAFGDDTAKNQGRLSLNPLVHIDLFGLLLILIAGFGWAKPTPVNRFKLKKRRLGSILVSLAGPISNLLLAVIGVGAYAFFLNYSFFADSILETFLMVFIQLNIVLFVFNLIPLPPLDGYQVLVEFLPLSARAKLEPVERYAMLIFLVIALTPISEFTIQPIFNTVIPFIYKMILGVFGLIPY